jgi:hypothetical protein
MAARPPAEPARSVLDGGEHGARLEPGGSSDQSRLLPAQLSSPVSTKPAGTTSIPTEAARRHDRLKLAEAEFG